MHELEKRLKGSRTGWVLEELFGNSAHFPLLNLFFELYRHNSAGYLGQPDPYLLLAAALVQALAAGALRARGRPLPLLVNLIGPACYTLAEVGLEGGAFFNESQHTAYWAYALAIGLIQTARLARPAGALLVLEHLVRTSMLLALYALFESKDGTYPLLAEFLKDPSHRFMFTVTPLLGLVVGFAALNAERYLAVLRHTAGELRRYSIWLLGEELLSRAVTDPGSLRLARRVRAVLFFDIRGFTRWCETRSPEEVVNMVNAYYDAAEPHWRAHRAIKVKLTADEIMLVLPDAATAVAVGRELHLALAQLLSRYRLAAGGGLHVGPLIEGVLGAGGRKDYDVLGDTVNVAKRLCQAAGPGELLLSRAARSETRATCGPARELMLKGKREALLAYPLVTRGGVRPPGRRVAE